MTAKSEVYEFLQLGAQYEIILAGLFDELTTQRKATTGLETEMNTNLRKINSSLQTMRDLESNSQDALRRVEIGLSAIREIEASIATINANLLRQRLISRVLLSYALLGSVVALLIWLAKF